MEGSAPYNQLVKKSNNTRNVFLPLATISYGIAMALVDSFNLYWQI